MTIDYGTDLSWADDLDATGRLVTGNTLLWQAAYRRLRTKRGSCLDAPDDGLDVADYLSLGMTPTELAAAPGEIRLELLKDDRFIGAEVKLTKLSQSFRLDIKITPSSGPTFELVLGVEAASVILLSSATGGA